MKQMRWTRGISPLILLGTLVLASCQSSGSPGGLEDIEGPQGQTSRVTIFLTDAPDDLEHVWLDITQIYLQGGPSGDGRTIVFDGPTGLIDVLELVDDALLLVEDAPVLAGRYAQLRVVIGEIVVETEDGRVFATSDAELPEDLSPTGTIVCPSCGSSGFKVLLQNEDLALLQDATLTLDFDAAETFAHRAGNSDRWVVHPTIKLSDFVTLDD